MLRANPWARRGVFPCGRMREVFMSRSLPNSPSSRSAAPLRAWVAAAILAPGLILAGCGRPAGDGPRSEAPPPEVYAQDTVRPDGFVPNPAFVPIVPTHDLRRSALRLEGEILVVEGDARTVSQAGGGVFGILPENQRAIVQEVLAVHPDIFDTIQIYTSFVDQAHLGSAYYSGIANAVSGIGIGSYNSRPSYGLPREGGRLSGFSNMNSMLMWGRGSFDGLDQVRSSYHAIIAQELSHRWLFFMRFRDGTGQLSDALIGRDGSHWSRLAHAYGSVQDGQWWEDNGGGTFHNQGTDLGFAPLDRYAMGMIPAEDVEPFFFIDGATLDGQPLGPTDRVPQFALVQGRRVDVTMTQILAAMGPRNPPAGIESPYYRAAFVLVTAPGEPRSSWGPHLEALQRVAANFPESWRRWTEGAGAMCTRVSELCPEPKIELAEVTVRDGNDDLLAPDEDFQLELAIQNAGIGTAEGVRVTLIPLDPAVEVFTDGVTAPPVPEGGRVTLSERFSLRVAADAECGSAVRLLARFATREGPTFSATFELGIGTRQVTFDPLEEGPDWRVDPDGDDDAVRGQWELGVPELVSITGVITQPGEDHTPGDGKLAFMTGPEAGAFFSDHDVDGGKTTLESPAFALRGTRDPVLVFYAWRVAVDLTRTPPGPVPGSDLVVQVTNDGGERWHELGRVTENTLEWTRVSLRIRDAVEPTNRIKFRFVIADQTTTGTVEAGIDDLEIIDYLESCEGIEGPETPDAGAGDGGGGGGMREDGGCGCTDLAPRPRVFSALAGLLVFGLWASRRRR